MGERNSAHESRATRRHNEQRQVDGVRIVLTLIGLAGAVGVLALNMGG